MATRHPRRSALHQEPFHDHRKRLHGPPSGEAMGGDGYSHSELRDRRLLSVPLPQARTLERARAVGTVHPEPFQCRRGSCPGAPQDDSESGLASPDQEHARRGWQADCHPAREACGNRRAGSELPGARVLSVLARQGLAEVPRLREHGQGDSELHQDPGVADAIAAGLRSSISCARTCPRDTAAHVHVRSSGRQSTGPRIESDKG
mmetsp:Transcript_759/g.3125  ORF Transcript_759/g.3125 Transcript_759/m.3125 type:complete len:205 (-) Transcript_759:681-1295(-)